MSRPIRVTCLVFLAAASCTQGAVFLNELFVNPPGSYDDTREFIELAGTPGKTLDGYAVAFVYGMTTKYFPLGSIPPVPNDHPEIDEFFSLDGLSLGANGLLVIGIGPQTNYPTVLSDTQFQRWNTIWNGGLDTPGKLNNDGSTTVLLIRKRPGATQANPLDPLGLRWGKDICVDCELITPVVDPQDGLTKDQFGNGNLDKGEPDNMGGTTLDLKGASTLNDISDDLEVVDEISWEDDRGWEYDMDDRHVDNGSTVPGLPYRHVHTLDDPQGFNPDCLSRVDYRTKGDGWTPATGGTGELPNGNNWQDTATEQWVRGESIVGTGGQGAAPQFFYDIAANTNPDAIQPYMTQIPLWLNDGSAPDFNFTTPNTYQIMAGRINPLLATPFIPGDADRDGDCDANDIAKIAAVFGDDDWVFSNSFEAAPQGDDGDPATQIRPWDVDATGNNGIEASDLQWTLNFQGNTTGRIVGVKYDSDTPTPSGSGVHLNSNAAVACTVTASYLPPAGRTLSTLKVGDLVQVTVAAHVTAGANTTTGQENGIMQFVHDVAFDTGGMMRVHSVEALGPFQTTRSAIQAAQGASGDLGMTNINGYTTSFTQGLSGAVDLYRVTFQAKGLGGTNVGIGPATAAKFAASTPHGLKVGHTNQAGNPNAASYPAAQALAVTATVLPDLDLDGDVDEADHAIFTACWSGPNIPYDPQNLPTGCTVTPDGQGIIPADADADGDVDQTDFAGYQRCFTGDGNGPPPQGCDALP